jgi:hypothetical protein
MAVQKLHVFCKAEKRKIFALREIIVQGKLSKKIDRLAKYIYYIEISLNTRFFKELIPKQLPKNKIVQKSLQRKTNEFAVNKHLLYYQTSV